MFSVSAQQGRGMADQMWLVTSNPTNKGRSGHRDLGHQQEWMVHGNGCTPCPVLIQKTQLLALIGQQVFRKDTRQNGLGLQERLKGQG